MPQKHHILLIALSLAGSVVHAQGLPDDYIRQEEAVKARISALDEVEIELPDDSKLNDSIARINSFIHSLEDSMQSFKILVDIEQKRAALLDTLSTMKLPDELSKTIDSLRSLPSGIQNLRKKLDVQKYQSADTLIYRYIDKARSYITEQSQKLKDKGSSLLPEDFYTKLEKLKSKTGQDFDPDALTRVDALTSKYELDYKKYLSTDQISDLLNQDLEFLNELDGYLGSLDAFTGKFDEYMGQLNSYMGKADLSGLSGGKLPNLGQYTDKVNLPDNLSTDAMKDKIPMDGIPGLEGMDTDEMQQLIEEYGSLDAEQLDQRIDQLAQRYDEIGELNKQSSAFDAMKNEQLGELEKMKSYAAMKFDKQSALKRGRVLANDQIINNSEIVQSAMKEIDGLKKKYSIVPNSNFKTEYVEKPKKHVQMQKRFFYGGDFQLLPGEPFGIDFSALTGYRVANRTSISLAASIRYEFKESEQYLPDFDAEPVYGARAFVTYNVKKSYYLQGEAEAANVYNEHEQKIWEINYLAGLGRSILIKDKIRMNIAFLYHINNKGSLAHDKPFVIRVGFSSK